MKLIILFWLGLIISGCASKNNHNHEMLEKFRQCYHHNVNISNACIEKNKKGEPTTALQLENSAYPGQYK